MKASWIVCGLWVVLSIQGGAAPIVGAGVQSRCATALVLLSDPLTFENYTRALNDAVKLLAGVAVTRRRGQGYFSRADAIANVFSNHGIDGADFNEFVTRLTDISVDEAMPHLHDRPFDNISRVAELTRFSGKHLLLFYHAMREYFGVERLESNAEFLKGYSEQLTEAYRAAYLFDFISRNVTRYSIPEMREQLRRGEAIDNGKSIQLEVSESQLRRLYFAFGFSRLDAWDVPFTPEEIANLHRLAPDTTTLKFNTPLELAIALYEGGRSYSSIAETLSRSKAPLHRDAQFGEKALEDVFHAAGVAPKGRAWSIDEVHSLRTRAHNRTAQQIADELDRTEPSVVAKKGTMDGLTRPNQRAQVQNFVNPRPDVPQHLRQVKRDGYLQEEALKRFLTDEWEENPEVLSSKHIGELAERLGVSTNELRIWAARVGVTPPSMVYPKPIRMTSGQRRDRGQLPPTATETRGDELKNVFDAIDLKYEAHLAKLIGALEEGKLEELIEKDEDARSFLDGLGRNIKLFVNIRRWLNEKKMKQKDATALISFMEKRDGELFKQLEKAVQAYEVEELKKDREKLKGYLTDAELELLESATWEGINPEHKAIIVKAHIVQYGVPKRYRIGIEDKLAHWIEGLISRGSPKMKGRFIEWVKAHPDNEHLKQLGTRLSREYSEELKKKAKSITAEFKEMLDIELVSSYLTTEEIELLNVATWEGRNPKHKAVMFKAYIVQHGVPKHDRIGIEGELAKWIQNLSRGMNPKIKEGLVDWVKAHPDNEHLKVLDTTLSGKNAEEVKKKAKSVTAEFKELLDIELVSSYLTTEEIELLNVATWEGKNPEYKLVMLKAYVVQHGVPKRKRGVFGTEDKLASWINSLNKGINLKIKERFIEWAEKNNEHPNISKLLEFLR